MSPLLSISLAAGASVAGGCSIAMVFRCLLERIRKQKQRERILLFSGAALPNQKSSFQDDVLLRYAERLTRELFGGVARPLITGSDTARAKANPLGMWYAKRADRSGCAHSISASGFSETCVRLAIIGAFSGLLFGCLFSTMLMIVLLPVGAGVGLLLPFFSIRKAVRKRTHEAELHLSEMLQIVSLGLRSGLTFDRSFALYGIYFDNGFARSCTRAYRQWTLGLCSREEALKELADSYDCDQLSRVIDSVLRSLKFGTALASILDEASVQARAVYRARLEERVAKAPVKMMLPTGTLILPAMLLLILGPVLLELAQGF